MHDLTPPAARTPRPRDACPALDAWVGEEITDGLNGGSLTVWDYMGSEASIADAARTSFRSVGKTAADDQRLIRRLLADRHTSPFEMAVLKVRVKAPIYVARQWVRHRMASWNEVSGRYSEMRDDFETVAEDRWRTQSKANKQGSAGLVDQGAGAGLTERQNALQRLSYDVYQDRLAAGVAREQARNDLPLSLMTEWVWKSDLHNLLNFLSLRCDPHAQAEIRAYADVLAGIVQVWMPAVYEAFADFRLDAVTLSGRAMFLLEERSLEERCAAARSWGWLESRDDGTLKPHSERERFEAFCRRTNVEVPW